MMVRLALAAGLVAGMITFAPHPTSAAPLGTQAGVLPAAAAEGTLVEQVQWWPRCRYWRRVCAARWGWGTPRFAVCMARHAC